jgi:4-hydroxy-3-methylbut-2-enyl diphosphate reductase
MCFGVRDALAALWEVPEPARAAIHGELVHNEAVLDSLRTRGFAMTSERDRERLPDAMLVVITAHGVSDTERSRLERAGKQLIDTTCPLVRRAHLAARALASRGYFVLVVGRPGHVEVRGLAEDLERAEVVADETAVRTYEADRLGVVFQTTTPPHRAESVLEAIRRANPHAEVRAVDTVCRPTKDRQRAVERLADEVEAIVVVGGRNSNNTRELVELARARGRPVWHVRDAGDLDARWFRGISVVGLTAGTSTLDTTIDEVERALAAVGAEDYPGDPSPGDVAGNVAFSAMPLTRR